MHHRVRVSKTLSELFIQRDSCNLLAVNSVHQPQAIDVNRLAARFVADAQVVEAAVDRSSTIQEKPLRARPSAAARPPMPPPAMITGNDDMPSTACLYLTSNLIIILIK
jgi:hypothetical protein